MASIENDPKAESSPLVVDHHGEGSSTTTNEADLSVDQVSQMMREQDADLLESMHYASSQVSQYSPGGTPILRPLDRSFPMEDVPLMLMPLPSPCQFLMTSESRTASFKDETSSLHTRSTTLATQSSSLLGGESSSTSKVSVAWNRETPEKDLTENQREDNQLRHEFSRLRRLLSGEVRTTVDRQSEEQEEEETTASPVSVAQDATTSIQTKQESGLAERRRVNEAIQFAEAVGEKIAIHSDELCIIEDHNDDGEDCDSDDDEACESKEIRVADLESIPESISCSAPAPPIDQQQQQLLEKRVPLPSHVDVRQTSDTIRRKSKRPLWPFGPAGSEYRFLDNLSDGMDQSSFVYKGICANPPEITKRGIQRGNYAQLHRKAWLEVSDKYHRYGKNLRIYYRYWDRLGFPTNQFFDWLDSKGEAAGRMLPHLDECPRSVLDSDTVLYINNPEVTDGYALDVICNEEGRGRVIDVDGRPVTTGNDGWIFVLRDNVMYGAQKITSISGQSKQRFHHSSFFGGKAVSAAGIIITDGEGYFIRLYPHSGHYRPGESHMQRMLFFLHRKGVDLRTFEMDTQQFRHVSREKETGKGKGKENKDGEKKMKKVDSLHMEKAVHVACSLAHKAGFIGNGIFDKIHKIRKADVTSVSEALEMVDDGGYWPKNEEADTLE
jgi:hypothetical protein